MSVGTAQSAFFADTSGMAQLRLGAQRHDEQAARETAQKFEALFIQMMLKSMRDAGFKSELFNSNQMQSYMELFDRQLALDMARQGGIGLADRIVAQMQPPGGMPPLSADGFPVPARVDIVPPPRFVAPLPAVDRGPAAAAPAHAAGAVPSRAPAFADRDDFITQMLPLARKAAARLGVPAEAIVAQSALETGWGQYVMQRPDGTPAWTMFGIKAGSGWQGDTVTVTTLEIIDGQAVRERARFRAYGSAAEAVADYVHFLTSRSRYAQALQVGSDVAAFALGLQRGGFATDPEYANKIKRIYAAVRRWGGG